MAVVGVGRVFVILLSITVLGVQCTDGVIEGLSDGEAENITDYVTSTPAQDTQWDTDETQTDPDPDLDSQQDSLFASPMLEIFPSLPSSRRRSFSMATEVVVEEKPEKPPVTFKKTFMDTVLPEYCGFSPIEHAPSKVKGKPESICSPRNITDNSTLEVQLVNSTTLLNMLGNKTDELGTCSVVLFFAPWCLFCSGIAPYYSALARAFPQLHILAIEAAQFSSLNTRYGTIAVPNILVFYNNSKGVAKFNVTERTFETFVGFVQNVTGFKANSSVEVEPEDAEGVFKTIWTHDSDWLLWLSWIFVILFFVTVFIKSNIGQNLINMVLNFGVEHHQHID